MKKEKERLDFRRGKDNINTYKCKAFCVNCKKEKPSPFLVPEDYVCDEHEKIVLEEKK